MAEDRPHNAQDGRCKYTWSRWRCPAPGVVKTGQWWVCGEHAGWAERPGDPVFKRDGIEALVEQVEQAAKDNPGEWPEGEVEELRRRAKEVLEQGQGQADQPRRVEGRRWVGLDPDLVELREEERERRAREVGIRAVRIFQDRRGMYLGRGFAPQAATEKAVGDVVVEAIEQRWGSGR